MGWMGKMVGGSIGFVLGGPLGAVAGAAFGHMFDANDNRQGVLVGDTDPSGDTRGQVTFFVGAFSMLAKIVRVDGRVTDAEMEVIRSFMTRDLRLNNRSRVMAEQIFRQALNDRRPFAAFARQFYREFQDAPELLGLMIDVMIRAAVADGSFHREKEEMVAGAAGIFRIPDEKYKDIRARHVKKATSGYYSVLGCNPEDSDETVKKQYRKKVKEYHPDTIAAKDLPDDFVAYANNRFREVKEAWEVIRRERGL